ncbi:MAG: hypothetical protein ACJAZX_000414 [Rickettsiales bacterium]|jgi:hypothetical protein
MTAPYYTLITDAGLNNHANAAANMQNLNLAKMVVGDSGGTYYDPDGGETSLVNQKYEVDLTHVVVDPNNKHQLIVEAVLDESVGPFYIREVGILDDNLDENGKGTLFAIGKYPETFKPDLPDGSGKRLYIRMIIGFASTPSVEVIINNDISLDPNFGIDVNNKLDYLLEKSGKNYIINGDFDIAQRGSSFSSVVSGQYTLDRWTYHKIGQMAHDISQDSDVPTFAQAGRKIYKSMLINCTNIDDTIDATQGSLIEQKIEGFNFRPLAEKKFNLSFWVKASKIGIYCVSFVNSGLDRSYVEEYEINSADSWEFKTITVSGSPIDGIWNYTNGFGLVARFALAMGSDFHATAGSWQTGNLRSTANQVNACDVVSNNFRLAGVQLEEGDVVTNFDSRTIQEELALCQRYYEKSYELDVPPGTPGQTDIKDLHVASFSTVGAGVLFRTEKRTVPSVALYNPTTGNIGQVDDLSNNNGTSYTVNYISASSKQISYFHTTSVPISPMFQICYTADAEL